MLPAAVVTPKQNYRQRQGLSGGERAHVHFNRASGKQSRTPHRRSASKPPGKVDHRAEKSARVHFYLSKQAAGKGKSYATKPINEGARQDAGAISSWSSETLPGARGVSGGPRFSTSTAAHPALIFLTNKTMATSPRKCFTGGWGRKELPQLYITSKVKGRAHPPSQGFDEFW